MPSHKPPFKNWDTYTTVPLLIFQIQSYARLNAIESMVFNHIVLFSLNVFGVNNSNARKWVVVSLTDFGADRGFSRQAVHEALKKLNEIGLIITRDVSVSTRSGTQTGREYSIVSNEKMFEIYDLLSTAFNHRGVNSGLTPVIGKSVVGVRPDFTPCQATLDTLSGPTLHLVRPHLTPVGVTIPKSFRISIGKDSLKNFKYFLKTFSDFENSFLELYTFEANSKAAEFKIKVKITSLIRAYGLYSTFIAMTACIFKTNAVTANYEALDTFLITNREKLKEAEMLLITQSDNLFLKLQALHMNTDITELKIFKQNFRQSAGALLLNVEFEQGSNEIFIYNGISEDVLYIWETCNFNMERFTDELIKKINMYFKAKILGMKGLSVAHASEYNI